MKTKFKRLETGKNFFIGLTLPMIMFAGCKSIETKNQSPNFIFILADDLGWADLPVYGNKFNEAPNITKLAQEGMLFTNAYATAPVCSPSRASIISGQYPARTGIIDWIPGHWRPFEEVIVPVNRTQYLPSEIVTIGESMKAVGYATGYFGKWHLGNEKQYHPKFQGFDDANIGQGYYNVIFDPPREVGSPKRLSELLTDFGEEFIEKNSHHPFFLFISHFDVHVQLDADQDLIDKYLHKEKVKNYPCNAVYAAMIEHLDRSVGRIVKKLKESGLEENTMLVFFSDNGGLNMRYDRAPLIANSKKPLYETDSLLYIASSNSPLRGEKGTLYEGGIREPMIVKWPAKIKAGSVSDAVVCGVDFFPTFVEIAGGILPPDQIMDGQSIVPQLSGRKLDNERTIFWHYPVYHHDFPSGAIRMGDWKLIENQVTREVSLFNLKSDVGESTDLARVYPEKKEEMYSLLKNWQLEINASLPKPNPLFDMKKRFEWGIHP